MRGSTLAALAVLLVAACGGEETSSGRRAGIETGSAGPRAVIETGEKEVVVVVEVADDPQERERGLMHRRSLPDDGGMVFVYAEDTQGGFWMKNTLIPLSIAFYDGDGRIVRILDMEPCRRDPCPIYDPGVTYRGALEVNRGAFERWGVSEGDTLRLEG